MQKKKSKAIIVIVIAAIIVIILFCFKSRKLNSLYAGNISDIEQVSKNLYNILGSTKYNRIIFITIQKRAGVTG